MNPKRVNLGIIGCGKGSRTHHLPVLARLPEWRVAAVCDTDPTVLARLELPATTPRLQSWRELVARPDLDAIAVVTPTLSHAEIGCAVLENGKHLFIEKPMAADRAGCERLIASERATGRKALVGLCNRWHRLVGEARRIVRSGELGPIRGVSSIYTHNHAGPAAQPWHRRRAEGGGVLLNDGVHHFDLWRHILGQDIEELSIHTVDTADFEDDTCTVSARLTGGILASALFSFSSAPESSLEIFGTRARLRLSLYRFDGLEVLPNSRYPGDLALRLKSGMITLRALPAALAALRGQDDSTRCFPAMWQHFADCILRDAPPACTLADGLRALSPLFAHRENSAPSA